MKEISITNPLSIESSLGRADEQSLMTVAAFMLVAGFRSATSQRTVDLIAEEDLTSLGLLGWWRRRFKSFGTTGIAWSRKDFLSLTEVQYYERFGELIRRAVNGENFEDTRKAVAAGLQCPDDLVRICALHSASRMFQLSQARMLQRLVWFHGKRELHPTTRELVSMLLADYVPGRQPPRSDYSTNSPTLPPCNQGLMLIHGTNFHWSRPLWSVPVTGPLHGYIQGLRPDVYKDPDYFRWEGGYSEYAREVAALNLVDWVRRRKLEGIDAVTHSHGGNVLIAATTLGLTFSNVIFLSCPVHWSIYRPPHGAITTGRSIRTRFDLVILADGGHQRFPESSGITEEVLPIWFARHGTTCEPETWRAQKLDRFL